MSSLQIAAAAAEDKFWQLFLIGRRKVKREGSECSQLSGGSLKVFVGRPFKDPRRKARGEPFCLSSSSL